MKRLVSLLLCLAMLLCMLAACGETPQTPEQTPSTGGDQPTDGTASGNADLIRLIFPDGSSDGLMAAVTRLHSALTDAGINLKKVSDGLADNVTNTDGEILVGATNRPASQNFVTNAQAGMYTVRPVENKIVLAGATDALTVKAIDYFIEHYLNNLSGGKLSLTEAYNGTVTYSLPFIQNGQSAYTISYERDPFNKSYLTQVAYSLSASIQKATGVSLSYNYQGSTLDTNKKQIMVGNFDFKEVETINRTLRIGGYAIVAEGNKIWITAVDEAAYYEAVQGFAEVLTLHALGSGNNLNCLLEEGVLKNETVNRDLSHLPAPFGHVPVRSIATANGGGWTTRFEDVSLDFFTDYGNALESAGFEEYTTSAFHGDTVQTKNYFATYINDKHAIHLSYHSYGDGVVYVITTPRADSPLPSLALPTYTDVTAQYPMAMVQVGEFDLRTNADSDATSMCYIMRLADGSFFIMDGGLYPGVGTRVYEILKKMAPDPNNIVISAWHLSHPHGDHIRAITEFAQKYAKDTTITLKQFIHNLPADALSGDFAKTQKEVLAAIRKIDENAVILRAHAGDVLHLPGLTVNVLYSQEEYLGFSGQMGDEGGGTSNGCSLVLQLVTKDGSKVIVGGDQPVQQEYTLLGGCEQALWKWYGSFIESDMVTTFHHGLGGGADSTVYSVIKPTIVFWCANWLKINTYDLDDQSRNAYFKTAGVKTYVADDNIQVAVFENGRITVTEYETYIDYKANSPKV